jgi:acetylornithine deacetylase/succinyl-diaminopimelate desuccinylase-like protein
VLTSGITWPKEHSMELPNAAFKQQVVDILGDLVRIDTTNPPGNETACARYLADLLAPAGIETQVIEPSPGRGNLIARLRGTGEGQGLMFMAHIDVVSANPSEWRYPPFAAEIHDGFMWGRGTTDTKNLAAVAAVVMLALASLGRPLKRDVVFMATADEEHGGNMGMGWLAENRSDLFDVACAINEGGGHPVQVAGKTFYTCQSAEKGVCRTQWTARAKGGHASHPRKDISTLKLARALCQLGDGYIAGRAIATMRTALRTIAATMSSQAAERVEALLDQNRLEDAMGAAGFDAEGIEHTLPLFYDTAAITGLRAGDPRSINVIPATSTAYVDGRVLPGQTRDGFIELLRKRAGDSIEVELYQGQYAPGLESSADTPIFQLISQVVADRCNGATVIPWQCAGATDARHVIPLGVPVYGFVPARPLPEGIEEAGAHADNERLWLENLPFTLEVLYDVAYRFCMQ